jgi:hypothetical protein
MQDLSWKGLDMGMTDDLIDTVRAALVLTPLTDADGNFVGHKDPIDHRTTGSRATGPEGDWCYRALPCRSCSDGVDAYSREWLAALCDEVERLQAELEDRRHPIIKAEVTRVVSDLARASAEVSAMQDLAAENERLRAELSNAERALPFCADSIEGECPRSDHWLREIKVLSVERDRWRKIADEALAAYDAAVKEVE